MHALKRFGTAFGGYKMMEDYPVPVCGPDDIIIEIKAAAICGADMKHWQVDNGYDDTNITPDQQQSVRGHEFAGEFVCRLEFLFSARREGKRSYRCVCKCFEKCFHTASNSLVPRI